jgi:hypothetical protein
MNESVRRSSCSKRAIAPFVERELQAQYGKYWITRVTQAGQTISVWSGDEDEPHLDVALLLRLMWEQWNDIFRKTLGHTERSLVSELREVRNKWAHQTPFSSDDAHRALDSAERLLTAISAPQAAEVEKMKMELLRLRFDEQARRSDAKVPAHAIESAASAILKPWREVITPHHDVASGNYQQPSSPPIYGRSTWAKGVTSTKIPSSFSGAPTLRRA